MAGGDVVGFRFTVEGFQLETLSFPAVRTEPAGFGNSKPCTVGRAWLHSVPGRGGTRAGGEALLS